MAEDAALDYIPSTFLKTSNGSSWPWPRSRSPNQLPWRSTSTSFVTGVRRWKDGNPLYLDADYADRRACAASWRRWGRS